MFFNQMCPHWKWFFPIWALFFLGLPGFCWQIHCLLLKRSSNISCSVKPFLTSSSSFQNSSLVGPLCCLIKSKHSVHAFLIELTTLRCSGYMPASFCRGIVYPQVSLTMLHHPLLLTFPPYPPCNVNISFPFWTWYFRTSSEQTHVLGFKSCLLADDSSTFLHPRLFSWVPNT